MRRDPEGAGESRGEPFWRWPNSVFDLFESGEDRAYGALVRALARQLADEEGTALEMDTTARRPMAEIQESERATEADVLAEAKRHLGTFRAALEYAHAGSGGDPRRGVAYDSADPQQDAMADVLIQYLVRTGYAEVRTEEPSPGRYVYTLTIAWDRLHRLAEAAGQPLPLGGR